MLIQHTQHQEVHIVKQPRRNKTWKPWENNDQFYIPLIYYIKNLRGQKPILFEMFCPSTFDIPEELSKYSYKDLHVYFQKQHYNFDDKNFFEFLKLNEIFNCSLLRAIFVGRRFDILPKLVNSALPIDLLCYLFSNKSKA